MVMDFSPVDKYGGTDWVQRCLPTAHEEEHTLPTAALVARFGLLHTAQNGLCQHLALWLGCPPSNYAYRFRANSPIGKALLSVMLFVTGIAQSRAR